MVMNSFENNESFSLLEVTYTQNLNCHRHVAALVTTALYFFFGVFGKYSEKNQLQFQTFTIVFL